MLLKSTGSPESMSARKSCRASCIDAVARSQSFSRPTKVEPIFEISVAASEQP